MEKNIVYSGTNANYTLNLDTDVEKVPQGTVVRVFNFIDPGVNLAAVNVVVRTSLATVSRLHMGEFLFWNDGGTGRWLVVVSNGSTNVLPTL
ncbi:MAG: hypothetical protein JST30_12880 [Armatimonadetes bacterium]|nr:hypothetical protein [Armatimonadota bacterium]